MVRITADTSELRTLAADLERVDGRLRRHLVPVMGKAALNVKTGIRRAFEASGNAGFRHVGRTVSYDLKVGGASVVAEVGPSSGRAPGSGALANVAIFGTSRGGGTVADPMLAAEAEAPRLEQYLSEVVDKLL